MSGSFTARTGRRVPDNKKEKEMDSQPGVVAHTFNPSTGEAEAGGSLSSRPAWSTEQVPGQPGLHRGNPVSKQNKQTKS